MCHALCAVHVYTPARRCMHVCASRLLEVTLHVCACMCVYMRCACLHVCRHVCACELVCVCVHTREWGAPALPPACPLTPAGWVSPQGVILCFGLCARGQVKTVLNVLHDFEERIQESEQSWQIGAWRVGPPRPTTRSPGAD